LNIYGQGSSGEIGLQIAFLYNGTISSYDGSSWHTLSRYQAGEWYDLRLTDFKTGSFSLYINGTLVSQGAKMRTAGPIQNLEFQTYTGVVGGSWYLSSAKVSYEVPGAAIGTVPPPSYFVSAILLEGFLAALTILIVGDYRHRRR